MALNSGVTLMARVRGNGGGLITRASLSTITYTVRDLTNATTIASAQSLTVASVVFDSLQQADPRWSRDSAAYPGGDSTHGFNFLATIPASHFDDVTVDSSTYDVTSHRYRVDVKFTPTSGEAFIIPFEFTALATWTA